jgi:hypothetical protein
VSFARLHDVYGWGQVAVLKDCRHLPILAFYYDDLRESEGLSRYELFFSTVEDRDEAFEYFNDAETLFEFMETCSLAGSTETQLRE